MGCRAHHNYPHFHEPMSNPSPSFLSNDTRDVVAAPSEDIEQLQVDEHLEAERLADLAEQERLLEYEADLARDKATHNKNLYSIEEEIHSNDDSHAQDDDDFERYEDGHYSPQPDYSYYEVQSSYYEYDFTYD